MTKIKICGLRREEDIAYVNECRPDYIGFVFANTRRRVTREEAAHLKELLHPEIAAAGVFVNEDMDVIAGLLNDGIIDLAQLHGEETEEQIRYLREHMKRGEIIKAIRVRSRADIVKDASLPVEYLLLDAFSERSYGGTGKTFDWSMIPAVEKPYFLAGGIRADNVEEAIYGLHPYGVDVSSALETDGFKDRDKILEFVAAVRCAKR